MKEAASGYTLEVKSEWIQGTRVLLWFTSSQASKEQS